MTYVVCELGANHNGRLDLALRLIEECAAAGADAVKLQAFTMDEIMALRGAEMVPEPWYSMGYTTPEALYTKAITPREWFPALVDTARQAGIPWFSSVFGLESLEMLEELGCNAYKLSAWDERVGWLLEAVKAKGKLVFVSTRDARPKKKIAHLTLYCPPGYPAHAADLARFVGSTCDGLSYHGTDWQVPARAAEMGAQMVEVHVQLDDEPAELDGHSSLTVSDLRRLCDAVRKKEAA